MTTKMRLKKLRKLFRIFRFIPYILGGRGVDTYRWRIPFFGSYFYRKLLLQKRAEMISNGLVGGAVFVATFFCQPNKLLKSSWYSSPWEKMAFMCFNCNLRRLQQRSLIDKQSNGHADFNSEAFSCTHSSFLFLITSLNKLSSFCGNLHLIIAARFWNGTINV